MTAAHSYSCKSGGQFGRRHNKVVFALKRMFETDLGLNGIERETSTCFKPGHTGDRMDLLIPVNQLLSPMVAAGLRVWADKGLMIDFTHCSNTGPSHGAYSAEQKSGARAEQSVVAGKHKYQGHYYPELLYVEMIES